MPATPIAPPSWLRVEVTPLMSAANRASTALITCPIRVANWQAETEAADREQDEQQRFAGTRRRTG